MQLAHVENLENIVEVHGPDEIITGLTGLLDPEIDAVVVRGIVTEEDAPTLFPKSWLASRDKAIPPRDIYAYNYYPALLEIAPQLNEVDTFIQDHWRELALAGLVLKDSFNGQFYTNDGSAPHNDVLHMIDTLNRRTSYFGPISGSLGLRGKARFGINRLASSFFNCADGKLQFEVADVELSRIANALMHCRAAHKAPSHIVQGIGDLALWVSPQTIHGIEILEHPRVAMLAYQTQTAA